MISGGEPFLKAELADFITLFKDNNKIKHVNIPTNGINKDLILNISEEILERNKDISVTISLSVDSLGKDHDALRGVPGNFTKVLDTYEGLRGLKAKYSNLALKFNTVITKDNYTKIDDIFLFVNNLKPDMHSFDFVRPEEYGLSNLLPPKEEIPLIIKKIKKFLSCYNGYGNLNMHISFLKKLSFSLMTKYYDVFYDVINNEKQVLSCKAYNLSLALYPNGDISFCEPLKSFGNVRAFEYDYRKLIDSKLARESRDFIKCKKCYCYHPCYQFLNILYSFLHMFRCIFK